MNSKQASRYIKNRMGNELKRQILVHNGAISDNDLQKKPSVLACIRCDLVNAIDGKYCFKCSYPLVQSVFEEIKAAEDAKLQEFKDRHEQEMRTMREEIQKDMKRQMFSIERAQKETQKQLEELIRYRSKTYGMLMRTI
jgi:integrase/recombinase XerD